MVHQGYIEPHACVARCGDRTARRRGLVRRPRARSSCATAAPAILGIDAATIKVIPSEIGGGFGGKITGLPRAAGARAVAQGEPPGEDGDDARGGVPRHRSDLRHEGSREDRREVATARSSPPPRRCGTKAAPIRARRRAPARCAASRATASPTSSSKRTTSSSTSRRSRRIARRDRRWRRSRPNRSIDEIARTLGMDPIELRLKNAVVEGDARAVRAASTGRSD